MPHPMKPIERTLAAFEVAAREYHQLRAKVARSQEERRALDKELRDRLADLKLRYNQLTVEADIAEQVANQEALQEYRAHNNKALDSDKAVSKAARATMKAEPHHPTEVLRKNMAAIGDVEPDRYCRCHHIVMGVGKKERDPVTNERRPTKNSLQARAKLHMLGIGINDPHNGVFLPASLAHVPHWRFPRALPHANIHTLAYEKMVVDYVGHLNDQQSLVQNLRRIRRHLEEGDRILFMREEKQLAYNEKMKLLA
ncbi:A nuclease family of the HNH/ENDO VII superfamily with conserved AHH [Microbulbifer donghaiensis]|uniref:A nuclease family of the HNH/ENDO VII superfamily with conserved AHH n=1 Tax=Microbulbifer donghaiensis TaxID=494016 RepID=A0A1M4XDT8_9GAMM|nr:AHH domain-containing protein [Microbulbifer donghaiensis]SHE91603.1 A nuclease family of the HNH/ENDO VII superfamily with conserved AHH [Microbulbifer donghaiensis]